MLNRLDVSRIVNHGRTLLPCLHVTRYVYVFAAQAFSLRVFALSIPETKHMSEGRKRGAPDDFLLRASVGERGESSHSSTNPQTHIVHAISWVRWMLRACPQR